VISPVSWEIVSIPDLAVAVSDRSVMLADATPRLAETVMAIIPEARKTIAASLVLDVGSFAGWICDPARPISAVLKARHATAAIEVSRCELARANRRAAADVMLSKCVRRRPSAHR